MALRHGVHAAASNLKRARVSRALAGNVLGSRHGLSGMCNEPKLTSPKNFRYDAPPDRQRGSKLALLLLRPIRAASRGRLQFFGTPNRRVSYCVPQVLHRSLQ
jgi:hypothetical protein